MTSDSIWAYRNEPNHTGETQFTRCDYCDYLRAIKQEKSKLHDYMYYCQRMRCEEGGFGKRMTFAELQMITKEECPEHREVRRRFR